MRFVFQLFTVTPVPFLTYRLAIAPNNQVLVPSNFKELFDLLCSSANASVAAAAHQDQHVLQVRPASTPTLGVVACVVVSA